MTRLAIGHQPGVKDILAIKMLASYDGEAVPAYPVVALPALQDVICARDVLGAYVAVPQNDGGRAP